MSVSDYDALRAAGAVAAEVLAVMRSAAIAGVRPTELDALGESVMHAHGARSAPRTAVNFPAATCISVNSAIAHGIPTTVPLRDGDLVNIDVSLELDGYWADMGASMAIGTPSPAVARLLAAGQEALAAALAEVRHGARLNRIGRAAEAVASRHGYTVIEDLCGHGVGRSLHEEPLEVYSHFVPDDRRRMRRGQVLAIEPFLAEGARHVCTGPDGWTLTTENGGLGVQFEHTVIVWDEGAEIVTKP